ncbi:MAG TPA: phosphate/phosphite/phosphonate ABC transporter substrate-binding protein [Thiobacillaceae bacterium]|nr:phosphate/phosphite/phosphonate ABC transporter substrate-binding protein [Thiobacillaceae bacterium]HNU65444.1 phosphate/phosphite/phosphonate ABC transporter substrate-binding protein [Thiobacillaceae bacterium]
MARLLLVCWLALFPGLAAADAFLIGVHPMHSMRMLVERFEPLRAYLETRLGRPVHVESAVDFKAYFRRTLEGDFDLAIIPAHLARIAQKDRGFQPLVQFLPDNDALLVCDTARPLSRPELLRHRRLAVIDPLAVTVMAVLGRLSAQGLEAGRDFSVATYHSHAGVAQALTSGQAMAGVTTTHAMQQIPDALRGRLRVVARLTEIPSFVVLAKPALPPAQVRRLRELLLAFSRSRVGQAFLRGIAFSAFAPAEERRLRHVDGYLAATRKALAP